LKEKLLRQYFDPDDYLIKLTPMHLTKSCEANNILTKDGYDFYYPYKEVEERLKSVGYDVIVFVPSYEEDFGRITCGNAILSGTKPFDKNLTTAL
jgi:23S rRNA (adenine2503-C2)-methyltransferase